MNVSHKNSSTIRRFAALISSVLVIPYKLLFGNRVTFGEHFITNLRLSISGPGKITFGKDVLAWARKEPNIFITFSKEATISIGDNTRLNGVEIQSKKGISIGNNCIIGSATIVDTDFHSLNLDRATNPDAPVASAPIIIEDNVWIAGHCAILKGVRIGENSVIGFGSIVRENVPPNSLVIGNPAKVVKTLFYRA